MFIVRCCGFAAAAAWSLISPAAAAEYTCPVSATSSTVIIAESSTDSEAARVNALQEEFKSGKISGCSLLESENGLVLVLGTDIEHGFAYVSLRSNPRSAAYVVFGDLSQIKIIKKVLRYGSGDAPWTCISN
jgi:hypothetical protein